MTAEIPKEVPVEQTESGEPKRIHSHPLYSLHLPAGRQAFAIGVRPYRELLERVFDERIELPPLSPDKEQALVATITEALATLPPRMQEVLVLRHGLLEQSGHTLMETGQLLDPPASRSRVWALERAALKRLRHPARARKLMNFFLPLPKDSMEKGGKQPKRL